MTINTLQLGDMQVVGDYPAKALKALAVIAAGLHSSYDALPDVDNPGYSKGCCVFSALAVRDFLVAVGFDDADVRPCAMLARSERDGIELHSIGVGAPGQQDRPGRFNGHAVVVVRSLSLLLDVTLYPAIRPQWRGALSPMIAVPLGGMEAAVADAAARISMLAGFSAKSEDDAGFHFDAAWIDRPDIPIKRAVDWNDGRSRRRRRAIARALAGLFGDWRDV